MVLLSLAGGCGTTHDPRPEFLEERAAETPTRLADACWGLRLAAPEESCVETLPGWTLHGTRMFVDGSAGLAQRQLGDAEVPERLSGFCLYRSTAEPGEELLPPEHGALDCPAVEPQGSAWSEALRGKLAQAFETQAGAVSPQTDTGAFAVTVSVVDAASGDASTVPRIQHADAMGAIIKTLACPQDTTCAVSVTNALALPLAADGSLVDPGGAEYGTRAHVALGIFDAVTAWRRSLQDGPPSRLVLNLSLGWATDPATNCIAGAACGCTEAQPWCDATSHVEDFSAFVDLGPSAATPPYPVRLATEAVHGALLYASCQGALILASAGNTKDGSCNATSMAPAGWASLAAPTPLQCMEMGFDPPASLPSQWQLHEANAPLVIPVAAVDHHDHPIARTRPGSLTRLVAPGYHALADGEAPLELDPITGTSASAATVAAGAALLWSHDPTLGPRAVLETLYGSGHPLDSIAQLPEYGSEPEKAVRRVSLCAALETLDPDLHACPDESAPADALDELHAAAVTVGDANEGAEHAPQVLPSFACSSCGRTRNVHATEGDELPVDTYLLWSCSTPDDERPLLAGPQPDLPVCPECPLRVSGLDGVAHLALNSAYDPTLIVGGWLEIRYDPRDDPRTTVVDLASVLDALAQGPVKVPLNLSHPVRDVRMGLRFSDGGPTSYMRSNALLIHGGR